jgi:hypothetical protein
MHPPSCVNCKYINHQFYVCNGGGYAKQGKPGNSTFFKIQYPEIRSIYDIINCIGNTWMEVADNIRVINHINRVHKVVNPLFFSCTRLDYFSKLVPQKTIPPRISADFISPPLNRSFLMVPVLAGLEKSHCINIKLYKSFGGSYLWAQGLSLFGSGTPHIP